MRSKAMFVFLCVLLLLLVPGPAQGEGSPPGLTGGSLDGSNASFYTSVDGGLLGMSVSIVGDVNGDGYDDVLIGQPGDDEIFTWEGLATLFLGGPGGWSLNMDIFSPGIAIFGETPGDWAGFSVSGAGDFNGDGLDDILIGAPKWNGGDGVAYLVLGREIWTDLNLGSDADAVFSGASGENAGWNVSPAGDQDGDGLADLIIGAPQFNSAQGRAYVLFGNVAPADRLLSDADVILEGEAPGDHAGYSVAGAGNVNGDATDDLVIGAPYANTDEGRVYLVTDLLPGPFPLSRNLSAADRLYYGIPSQYLGWSVDMVNDMNGDGFADLLAGFSTTTGGAYLVLGGSSPKANCTLDSCADQGYRGVTDSSTGGRVASVGDVNGDGYGDLAIGACGYPNSTNQGRVSLILGEPNPSGVVDLGVDVDTHYTGVNAGDSGCIAQNGMGDVNGDGLSDLVIGAPDYGSKRGTAYLVFADETSAVSARYRVWNPAAYSQNQRVGQSGVTVSQVSSQSSGSLYVTRQFRGTCNTARDTNGLLWTIDSQLGQNAIVRVTFKYNNTQIAGWNEANLKLWFRDRPCQDWMEDVSAVLETATNRIFSSSVTDPHREYTIAPTAPSPTQLGLTGIGAMLPTEPPWQVIGVVLLVAMTVAAELWRKRP